jgi:hypothetical protein
VHYWGKSGGGGFAAPPPLGISVCEVIGGYINGQPYGNLQYAQPQTTAVADA